MKFRNVRRLLAAALFLILAPVTVPADQSPVVAVSDKKGTVQQSFESPEAAIKALAHAVRAQDVQALLAVVGPASRSWLFSGDPVADRNDWKKFLAAYDRKHGINRINDSTVVLVVGEDDWSFPAPLTKQDKRWKFDDTAGREEVINRRVGRNELDTMQTLLAIVDAQREYAIIDPDHNGSRAYARRFISTAGKKDGLYWPTSTGETPSPLGPLVGAATREGYLLKSGKAGYQPQPYHGYFYRLLTAQGRSAKGGAYDYLVKGKQIGGFAIIAYPAKYGISGVMTFIVNHDSVIYQKDLGTATGSDAGKIVQFNPDSTWKKSQ